MPAASIQYVVVVPVLVVCTDVDVISTVAGEQTAGGFAIVSVTTGSTVTVTVVCEVHAPAVAVMVNVVVCCIAVVLVRVPLIVGPVPVFAIPVRFVVLSLDQPNVVPGTLFGLVIVIVPIAPGEQIVCMAGEAFTVGVGG